MEKNGQLIIKNISGKPIVAYVLTSINKSQDGSSTRTYSGKFSGEDSLGPGQSMEIAPTRPTCGKFSGDRNDPATPDSLGPF